MWAAVLLCCRRYCWPRRRGAHRCGVGWRDLHATFRSHVLDQIFDGMADDDLN